MNDLKKKPFRKLLGRRCICFLKLVIVISLESNRLSSAQKWRWKRNALLFDEVIFWTNLIHRPETKFAKLTKRNKVNIWMRLIWIHLWSFQTPVSRRIRTYRLISRSLLFFCFKLKQNSRIPLWSDKLIIPASLGVSCWKLKNISKKITKIGHRNFHWFTFLLILNLSFASRNFTVCSLKKNLSTTISNEIP